MGLVHHEQPEPGDELGQLLLAEHRVVEPFRGDQQDVELVGLQPGGDLAPLGGVGGVDGRGPHPRAGGGGDLVPHQRQQRGDDQGGPPAAGAQQQGGEEVDRGLAPPGALHHQGPPAVAHEGLHRLELAGVEGGVRPPGEGTQQPERVLAQSRVGGDGVRGR